ncbi:hypothetical protein RJ641_006394 [Dillenia turbinata]|uniref:Uncharacterized protein n=1 Tax=Dillenia turbinata TaxID=194707 RepID=A0AAN8V3M2_9MAGN
MTHITDGIFRVASPHSISSLTAPARLLASRLRCRLVVTALTGDLRLHVRNFTAIAFRVSLEASFQTHVGSQNPSFSIDSLVNLTNLMSFNASNFLLPGQIPDLFGDKLMLLQVLDLRSSSVVGPIPLSLGNSSNLTSLYLPNNRITGLIPSSLVKWLLVEEVQNNDKLIIVGETGSGKTIRGVFFSDDHELGIVLSIIAALTCCSYDFPNHLVIFCASMSSMLIDIGSSYICDCFAKMRLSYETECSTLHSTTLVK